MRTRDKLAAELRAVGAMTADNAAKYEAFAKRAETGEFDDYGDAHACGPSQLYAELIAAGLKKFAQRVAAGEFDATKEESDEWANSPSGQKVLANLSPALAAILMGKGKPC